MKSELWVGDNADLLWYFTKAESELGVQAITLEGGSGSVLHFDEVLRIQTVRGPTRWQQNAARKQRRVREGLRRITPRAQACLELAYSRDVSGVAKLAPETASRYGRAASIVLRIEHALRASDELGAAVRAEAIVEAVAFLRGAQLEYELAAALILRDEKREAQRMKRNGERVRIALLERLRRRERVRERVRFWEAMGVA